MSIAHISLASPLFGLYDEIISKMMSSTNRMLKADQSLRLHFILQSGALSGHNVRHKDEKAAIVLRLQPHPTLSSHQRDRYVYTKTKDDPCNDDDDGSKRVIAIISSLGLLRPVRVG